jgi:hypothetical protein
MSDSVLDFIRQSIKSVWALELLLLLHRNSDRTWSVCDLSREMRGSEMMVGDIVKKFKDDGLVSILESGELRYQPEDKLSNIITDLSSVYLETPLAVIKAILDSPNDRIQLFADAFKFRNNK